MNAYLCVELTLITWHAIDLIAGDCGSWVVDAETKEVFGHVVAVDVLREAYVIPLDELFLDIKRVLGANTVRLPTRREVEQQRHSSQQPVKLIDDLKEHARRGLEAGNSKRAEVNLIEDIKQLAWQICVFFKNVQDADATAKRIYEKTRQLHQTLESVEGALRRRKGQGRPKSSNEAQITSNIRTSLESSRQILLKIEKKADRLNEQQEHSSSTRAVPRLQFTLKQKAVQRHEEDLDIQNQALQTSLQALQL